MENAVSAVNKLFAKDSASDLPEDANATNSSSSSSASASTARDVETVDSEVAPTVEHTHVRKEHETRQQTFLKKEKHQDQYHTTVQPLKDSEVQPETHEHIQETEHRNINQYDGSAKAKAEAGRSGFESTSEQKEFESKTHVASSLA